MFYPLSEFSVKQILYEVAMCAKGSLDNDLQCELMRHAVQNAVTATVYVPDGVPRVVWLNDQPLPPHPTECIRAIRTVGGGKGRRPFAISHP